MNEAFDKWLWNYDNGGLHCYDDCKAAFKAGMLRAAEICKSKHENMDSRLNYVAGWLDAEAAIRKEAVE